MPLESQILEIIEGRRSAPIIRGVLRAMSYGYGILAAMKNSAYEAKVLPIVKVPSLVISIGNVVAGGTGKTPLVIHLARELVKREKIALLSRGYRSEVEKSSQPVTIEHLSGLPAQFYGDEPYLISKNVPEALVLVGKNRIASAKRAHLLGARLIILDDGMQYRKLARDFEIVSLDASDPFGRGFYLPRGFLRDCPKRLRHADLLVINFVQNQEQLQRTEKIVRHYSSSPIVGMKIVVTNACEIKGKRVGAFCAIAKPERFFETLKNCEAEVVEKITNLDHFAFLEKELLEFSKRARQAGAELLVCTEKDRVKLSDALELALDLPLVSIKTELEIVSGREHWQGLIEKIHQKLKERNST